MRPSNGVAVKVRLAARRSGDGPTPATRGPRSRAATSSVDIVDSGVDRAPRSPPKQQYEPGAIIGAVHTETPWAPAFRENPAIPLHGADKRLFMHPQTARHRPRGLRVGPPHLRRTAAMRSQPIGLVRRQTVPGAAAAIGAIAPSPRILPRAGRAGARRLHHGAHRPVDGRRAGQPGAQLPAVGRAAERRRRPDVKGAKRQIELVSSDDRSDNRDLRAQLREADGQRQGRPGAAALGRRRQLRRRAAGQPLRLPLPGADRAVAQAGRHELPYFFCCCSSPRRCAARWSTC